MICKITNTDGSPSLIAKYPVLSKYGYRNERKDGFYSVGEITLNSLEELSSIVENVHNNLVVDIDCDGTLLIEIYDGWRE